MLLLNFAHPLTPAQREQVETLAGQAIERVIDVPAQMANGEPFAAQVVSLADAVGLTPEQWQTLPILVNPPSLNVIVATLLAEIHGRMGHFPSVLRLRPVPDSNPPQFEVAETINLQAVRDAARARR